MSPEIREISEHMKASLGEIVFRLPNTLPSEASGAVGEPGEYGSGREDLLPLKVELVIAIAALKAEQERSRALSERLDSLRVRVGAYGNRGSEFSMIERCLTAERNRIDERRVARQRWAERVETLLDPAPSQRRRLLGWMGRPRDLAPA